MLKFEGIRGFHEELYNIGFLLVFNWKSWLNQNEIYRIEQTKYIYVEIFNDVIINGHVTNTIDLQATWLRI
ncbi:hypothetical protein AB0Y20_25970 [Heyndrickxia oleronia]|uniref:hypothetical protein n=1 Tax=Heyndrickxia TaxID=2837504 RepID=UPI003F27DA6C